MDGNTRAELTRLLDGGQLVLHYQPVVDAGSGVVRALETLARWRPSDGRLRGAGWLFGRVDGRNELLRELDRMVVALMLEERAMSAPLRDVRISVNQDRASVSFEQLAMLADSLAGREGGRFAVEVFEHLDETQLAAMPVLTAELSDAGVELWHDDFGTGERAIPHLIAMPSTVVKLCPELAMEGVESARVRRHVRSLIAMMHNLGKVVVAEGVQDAASTAWLVEAGADWLQGWHVAKPMPAAEIAAWIEAREARAA